MFSWMHFHRLAIHGARFRLSQWLLCPSLRAKLLLGAGSRLARQTKDDEQEVAPFCPSVGRRPKGQFRWL